MSLSALPYSHTKALLALGACQTGLMQTTITSALVTPFPRLQAGTRSGLLPIRLLKGTRC